MKGQNKKLQNVLDEYHLNEMSVGPKRFGPKRYTVLP